MAFLFLLYCHFSHLRDTFIAEDGKNDVPIEISLDVEFKVVAGMAV